MWIGEEYILTNYVCQTLSTRFLYVRALVSCDVCFWHYCNIDKTRNKEMTVQLDYIDFRSSMGDASTTSDYTIEAVALATSTSRIEDWS